MRRYGPICHRQTKWKVAVSWEANLMARVGQDIAAMSAKDHK
jgi:hypothetical protein